MTRHGTVEDQVAELRVEFERIEGELRVAPTLLDRSEPGPRMVNPRLLTLLARERQVVRALKAARATDRSAARS